MKLKVTSFYQGWASNEQPWEQGSIVNVSDAERDLPSPDAPDRPRRGSVAEYLLTTFPDRFAEDKPKRVKKAEE